MNTKSLRSRLVGETEPLLGMIFESFCTPALIELAGLVGYDFVILDGEHCEDVHAADAQLIGNMVRAADSVGIPALVRVAELSRAEIIRALDIGADGILVPFVSSAADAARAVELARFPPLGHRGLGPVRAHRYMTSGGVDLQQRTWDEILVPTRRANENVSVIAIIETIAGVENIDEILTVEGIDAVWPGPGDLVLELAAAGIASRLGEHLARVHEAASSRGLPTIAFAMPDRAGKQVLRGTRVVVNTEFHLIAAAFEAAQAESRRGIVDAWTSRRGG